MGTDEANNERVVIRRATIDDAREITALYLGSRKRHVAYATAAHSDQEVGRWIRSILIPKGGVTVIEAAGKIVAMMAVSSTDQVSWIDQLYVDPDRLGRGHGRKLVEQAKAELSSPIQLYTFQPNTRARRFFERLGFVTVSFSDGRDNEERCPDVLYRWNGSVPWGRAPW